MKVRKWHVAAMLVSVSIVISVAGQELTLDAFSGVYTVDYKRTTGSAGYNRLVVDFADVAPYTPVHIVASNHALRVIFSSYNGTPRTNLLIVGMGKMEWSWEKDALLQTASTNAIGLMIPGAVTVHERTRLSRDSEGNLVVSKSVVEQGRVLWVLPWKDPPVTASLVLSLVTNLNELAETRKRWEARNKRTHDISR